MSNMQEEEIKRWAAKRKSVLITEIIQGRKTVVEASQQFDLPHSEIEGRVDQTKADKKNAPGARPEDIRQQSNTRSKICRKRMARPCWNFVSEKNGAPAKQGRIVRQNINTSTNIK